MQWLESGWMNWRCYKKGCNNNKNKNGNRGHVILTRLPFVLLEVYYKSELDIVPALFRSLLMFQHHGTSIHEGVHHGCHDEGGDNIEYGMLL